MASISMNIRIDSEIKKQAEELFSQFGLNMTTAVNMFLRQSVRNQSLPLDLSLKPAETERKDITDLIGKIKFADDYNYKSLREGHS